MKGKIILSFNSNEFEINLYNIFSSKLSAFTIINIELNHMGKKTILYYNDFLLEGVKIFNSMLQKSINKELKIDYSLNNQEIGKVWNKYYYNLFVNDDFDCVDITSQYILWSTPSKILTQTWLYNKGNKIMFEVTPIYDINIYGEKKHIFSSFIDNYHSILKVAIPENIIIEWLKKTSQLLIKIDQ